MAEARIRLYVEQALAPGQPVSLTQDQAHYLFGVMRLSRGDEVLLFNGRDGEWRAGVAEAGKRGGVLDPLAQTRPLQAPPDLWLLFAPIRKARTDFIVEKAVELGVARLLPVQTRFTNADRIRQDRLQAHAVEAAEQCGATVVPEVADLAALDRVLADWPPERRLMWCDERLTGAAAGLPALAAALGGHAARGFDAPEAPMRPAPGPWAILIGPEGGFAPAEQDRLRALPQAVAVSLGPRILRADTAAVAAIALWQATVGDWNA